MKFQEKEFERTATDGYRNHYAGEAVSLLRKLVAIPSVSFSENVVSEFLSEFLKERDVRHNRLGNNVIAYNKFFDPGKKTLMLNAHMDTVPAAEGYDFDPHEPEREIVEEIFGMPYEDLVCGLGSNDDGGCVVSMLFSFLHFHTAVLPFNLLMVLSCEEERSGPGGMSLVWNNFNTVPGLGNADRPEWAIVGEPTGMKAATSERGLLVIDGEAEGIAGHAAREEGVNALYIALDDIDRLRKHTFGKISEEMGKVRLSVTQIEAGNAHNVIPAKCRFVVDVRPTELYDNASLMEELQNLCKSRLKARNLGNRSSATSRNSPLRKCAEMLGIGTFSSPTTSDWIRIGCDAVKMGPGESSRSHRKNEYITRNEISEGILGYISFIEKFAEIYDQQNSTRGTRCP